MKKLEYTIRFNTPAFLGNADQDGQWRTPPFKALLRQWWRVAYAAEHPGNLSVDRMRKEEGQLFGVASDAGSGSRKSQVRLRLDRWGVGRQKHWQSLGQVKHPNKPFPIDSGLYLGYGPVSRPTRGTTQPLLKGNAAIQAGEEATLAIACPDASVPQLEKALALIDRFGTIGGRSRNGWGSFDLSHKNGDSLAFDPPGQPLLRPWTDALCEDWPHAIGSDQRGALVWRSTEATRDWKQVMHRLAVLKIGLRTQFLFKTGKNTPKPEARHWLSYPVTNHDVAPWKTKNARLPNSLRFKVRADENGNLFAVIFHVPCLPPQDPFQPDRHAIEAVWAQVHAYLDDPAQSLTRIPV
jgi:CRISPR-associated protein Cmr1